MMIFDQMFDKKKEGNFDKLDLHKSVTSFTSTAISIQYGCIISKHPNVYATCNNSLNSEVYIMNKIIVYLSCL